MIHDDSDRVFGASKVLAPFLKSVNYCKEFAIIDIVISLGRSKSLRVIGTGVEIPIAILLHQHSSRDNK